MISVRRVRSTMLAGALTAAGLLAGPAEATAGAATTGWHAGYCTYADAGAVTIVVDYQDLTGTTLIRCAVNLPAGASGLTALSAAGIAVTGTAHDTSSTFVCRLLGRPTATEVVPIPGNPGYTESCQNTPPAAAYWGYWSAAPGSGWAYNTAGAGGHRASIGGFEGWSFSHNRTTATNPAPRVNPTAPLRPVPAPTISGTARTGPVLTANPGAWGPAPVTLTYSWRANGVTVTGATSPTFRPAAAQVGKTMVVIVTGRKPGFATVSRNSPPTAAVVGVLTSTPTPTIVGTTRVGGTLVVHPGAWGPAPVTLKYTWRANGVAISGATATAFTLTTAQRGKRLTVTATGSRPGYLAVAKTSAATGVIG